MPTNARGSSTKLLLAKASSPMAGFGPISIVPKFFAFGLI